MKLFLTILALLGAVTLTHAAGSTTAKLKIAEDLTTNTTSTAVPVPAGTKVVYGIVTGTGAVTQTQALYGDIDSDAANGDLLCTLTLSGTTTAKDACPPFDAPYSYFYVVTTLTTGTSASGVIYAMY